jgi:hypothetical protein
MNKNRPLDFLKVQALAYALLVLSSACAAQPKVTPSFPPTEAPSEQATIVTFAPDQSEPISSETLSLAQKLLQERLDAVLAGDSEVQVVNNALRVKLSNEKDLPVAVELATDRGEFNFVDSDKPISAGGFIPASPIVIMTNADIDNATASNISNMQTWIIDVTLTPEGQRKLSEYTKSHIGNYVVITQDNAVLSSTSVNVAYERGQIEIVGEFDKATAEVIATQLNTGRLPIQLIVAK